MTARSLALLLALAALVAGCGTPGGDSADNAKKAEESKKNSAKIDVAKAGDVTLTIWDQEVRGGQAAQIKRLNEAFQAKYPNVKIKRVAKSFTDLNTTLKLAVSGHKAPDIVQANQGRPVMGALVKGGLLKPLDAYADAYGWNDRWSEDAARPQPLLPRRQGVRRRQPLRRLADGRDRRRLLQQGQGRPRSPRRSASSRTCWPRRRATARSRSRSATSTSSAGIHEFQTVQNQFAGKQATRDFVFAKRRRDLRHAREPRGGDEAAGVGRQGLLHAGLQRHRLRPGVAAVRQGQGPVHDRRHLDHRRPRSSALGDKLGFFLMPGREAGGDPVSLGGESLPWAITAKSKNPDVAAAYIDFLTNAKAADVLVETDNLPAMAGDARSPRRRSARTSSPPGRRSTTPTASRRTSTTRRRRSTTTSPAPCRS